MSEEPNGTAEEDAGTLKKEIIEQLRKDFAEEFSKRSLERAREMTRRRIAYVLLGALIGVVFLTFLYLLWLSRKFGELTMDEMVSVIPMVGTTLLTPLVGLIGAVTGFYFGGQVATRASQDTMDAVKVGVGMGRDNYSPKASQPDDPSR